MTVGRARTTCATTTARRTRRPRTLLSATAARTTRTATTGTARALACATRTTGTTLLRTGASAAPGLLRAAAVGIAVAGRAGLHAIGHVPSAERSRIAIWQGARALVGTLLERLLRLLGRRVAADGQAAMRLARTAATTAAIFAHVVEATQLTAFVGATVVALSLIHI